MKPSVFADRNRAHVSVPSEKVRVCNSYPRLFPWRKPVRSSARLFDGAMTRTGDKACGTYHVPENDKPRRWANSHDLSRVCGCFPARLIAWKSNVQISRVPLRPEYSPVGITARIRISGTAFAKTLACGNKKFA